MKIKKLLKIIMIIASIVAVSISGALISSDFDNDGSAYAAANSKKHKKKHNNNTDLSAFHVKAIRAESSDLLPSSADTPLLNNLKADINKKNEKKKTFLDGKGIIGDIYRKGKNVLDKFDAATLNASRAVIGDATNLDIEGAKLRPGGGGAKLKLNISPNVFKHKNKESNKENNNNKENNINNNAASGDRAGEN